MPLTLDTRPIRQVLRARQVAELLSIGKSTLYDWMNPRSPRYDPVFPKPVKLGMASVGWLAPEIEEWLARRVSSTRKRVEIME